MFIDNHGNEEASLMREAQQQQQVRTLDDPIDIINVQLTIENFQKWQKEDANIQKIRKSLENAALDPTSTFKLAQLYKIEDDLLYINNTKLKQRHHGKKNFLRRFVIQQEWSLYVPNVVIENTQIEIKWAILRWYHGLPVSGHLGILGTYTMVRQKYYWPNMIHDVKRWIHSCQPCQRRKQPKPIRQGEHRSVLHTRSFEIVSVDLVGPFIENEKGNKYILTIIDHFTRYPIAIPIPDKTASTVATALKTHLFMQFPFWPRKTLSDNGKEFVNEALLLIYKQLGIKRILTAHDNAQANQGERFHKYMNAAISCFIEKKHRQIQIGKIILTQLYMFTDA